MRTNKLAPCVRENGVRSIPQPRQVDLAGKGFTPVKCAVIHVSNTSEDRFAASLLQNALRETHGIDLSVLLLPFSPGGRHELCLMQGNNEPGEAPAVSIEKSAEGYGLCVAEHGARVTAPAAAGLFYGVQTLIQLAVQSQREKRAIPGLQIADWPTFGLRAHYIEGSQTKGSVVTTRANLELTIRQLAQFKLNCLIMDIYNLAPLKSFPYCTDSDTLSTADWNYLVELAHRYHVTIIPGLMSLSQTSELIWNCKEGEPYREPTAPGLLCPSRPENIKFLQSLYADLISIFKYSPFISVGCSEIGMQWKERYCPLCKKRIASGETLNDILTKHMQNCAEAVRGAAKEAGRNVRPMIWADEFYMGYGGKRWINIEMVPTDVVMGHWMYWNAGPNTGAAYTHGYSGMASLLERGYDVLFLSASYTFNTYIQGLSPDNPSEGRNWNELTSGIYNIADQAHQACEFERKGYKGKVVGGGCATFSQHDLRCWDTTWYAYALQAEYSWGDPIRPLASLKQQFTDDFAAIFYGARDCKTAKTIAAAYCELDAAKSDIERNNQFVRDIIGEYDIINTAYYLNNKLEDSLKLIDGLLYGSQAKPAKVREIRARAKKAWKVAQQYRDRLALLSSRVQNTYSLRWLVWAARKIANHAERTLYMLDQQETLGRKYSLPEIDQLSSRLAALRADTQAIVDQVETLTWRLDGTGYRSVVKSLDQFAKLLSDAHVVVTVK
ncbi:MAG: family 20 glycosylhydrolase [Kiritimatiellaeota bacterium]|nr:family 20 glycosylhydrolase [Kiritimatiellota bacterium]